MLKRALAWSCALGLGLAVAHCGDDSPQPVNGTCQVDADCAEQICHAGICASPKPVDNGTACEGDGDCKSYNCVSGSCAAGVTQTDEACRNNEECATLNCVSGTCALKDDGATCADDAECKGGICYKQACTKSCTGPDDCGPRQDCGTDDGKRLLCYDRPYSSKVGMTCAFTGSCPDDMTCTGGAFEASARCTDSCTTDMDCPMDMQCDEGFDGKKRCIARRFCSECLHDGNCPPDHMCVTENGASFCTKTCRKGSTECPAYAECKDVGGKAVCVHKSGKCRADGKLCDPCTATADCDASNDAACVTFNVSEEPFCGKKCTGSADCGTGYRCYAVSTSLQQCGPDAASGIPTCTKGLTIPIYEKGDVMDDFAIVGYKDEDGDNSLLGEKVAIVKLSDFKDKKLILFNISAFW